MGDKLITIIIATLNASATVAQCLDSIIDQKTAECELLVIDGNSSDATSHIVKSYGKKIDCFLCETDSGVYDAWNKGINISTGAWVMFLGSDDILLPNALGNILNVLKNSVGVDDLDYICARNEYVDKHGRILTKIGGEPTWRKMRKMMVAAHVGSLHNKSRLFGRSGLYNLDYRICADYELLLRKGKNLRYLYVPITIAKMRVGGISFSYGAIWETYQIRSVHNSVHPLFNRALFLYNWLAYSLFVYRKRLCGANL